MTIRFEELLEAYRKAKVDIFYSNDDRALDLLSYEENLEGNLRRLEDALPGALNHASGANAVGDNPLFSTAFIGSFTVMPKKLEVIPRRSEGPNSQTKSSRAKSLYSDATDGWNSQAQSGRLEADFRILSVCSIDFHVLATLWITRVGHKFDDLLGHENEPSRLNGYKKELTAAFGNRLRRTRKDKFNESAPSTLKPYLFQYQRWQQLGFTAANEALAHGEEVVIICTDIRSFFPSLDPQFLLHEDFIDACGIKLTQDELNLHQLFVASLLAWRKRTARDLGIDENYVGLPIGVSASGVIANVALRKFDQIIDQQINPIHYGRYVDDVLIVLRGNEALRSPTTVWQWIQSRFMDGDEPLIIRTDSVPEECTSKGSCCEPVHGFKFVDPSLDGSKVIFSESKTRAYFLKGESGKTLLQTLQKEIQARASEWRELPDLPKTADYLAREVLVASTKDGSKATSLQATESFDIKIAEFALKLGDVEAYATDLDPDSWSTHRSAFFFAVTEFVLKLPNFFAFERYIPRLLLLALNCRDWDALALLIKTINEAFSSYKREIVTVRINNSCPSSHTNKLVAVKWGQRFQNMICKSVLRGAGKGIPAVLAEQIDEVLNELDSSSSAAVSGHLSKEAHFRLLASDLAATPIRSLYLPASWSNETPDVEAVLRAATALGPDIAGMENVDARVRVLSIVRDAPKSRLNKDTISGLERLGGIAFPTRPPAPSELFAATRALSPRTENRGELDNNERISALGEIFCSIRGYNLEQGSLPTVYSATGSPFVVSFPSNLPKRDATKSVNIALATVRTEIEQLTKALHGTPDLSRERYARLIALANEVIHNKAVDYLVMPELSMPVRWFMRFARKLATAGISVIAGVEYQPDIMARTVTNEVWVSIAHSEWGFPTNILYVQDKQRAAHNEEINLLRENRLGLTPTEEWTDPPIIKFGDFRFALLICSELTNIAYRSTLRGKIDALVVPQWNKDTNSFKSLVESSALDIHAFIVQVNNRLHGDTRIRTPRKNSWERDIVKVSGGTQDHVIIGSVDVISLRRFQSKHNPSDESFKPTPDGFTLDPDRCFYK